MTTRPFRMIDVFASDAPLTGNPLAVVLDAEGLTTEQMARFSAWTNLSECTFVLPPTDPAADYRVRIFSLTTELPFAGHPTLGTARAWLDAGGVPRTPGRVVQECGVGLVPVRIDDVALAFAAPPLVRSGAVDDADLAVALSVLGVAADDVVAAEWIDNGPGWMGILLRDADAVLVVEPDLASRVGQWSIGVVGPYAPGSDAALEVRAFFNDSGGPLREDPVTGSLNASIAQWLTASGSVQAPYVARQGAKVGRDGRVRVTRAEGEIWIGGRAVVIVAGAVDL
ncbi:PhzF family phenazine biosynthesis protein [Demequina sp. TTPB684]|uniref:PhzF family phenazine biosynthesis protein n=1 Tax=unclassified Demequina TaxID=2620311 RepID=UPI001CF39AB4|nr:MULTISPECIES: PhzF family phenazine biosynthesis protein [unclassified Demequina]MCB2413947.1 PhzF family phenazine biosynthesis protein [Demequina sp. TTPB684]UPU88700.1 PhzF family phenazine biosynthesis protein [Demequina sp. TMPB413]